MTQSLSPEQPPPEQQPPVAVGDRLIVAKQRATVRFVGPVDGHEGLWVGVEWDDATRGKHDGATGGRRYFRCSNRESAAAGAAATAASFVRASKVSAGRSLVDALVLRYTNQLAEASSAATAAAQQQQQGEEDGAPAPAARRTRLCVELIGQAQVTARQSQLELLTSARVVGANVSHVGPPGELAARLPSLQQLDASDNLISSWAGTVAPICSELPHLRLLNLSLNRLQLPAAWPAGGTALQPQLPGLRCLVLNQCSISWQQVGVLQSCLPHLEELHVAGNDIHSLQLQPAHSTDNEDQQQQQQLPPGLLAGFSSLKVLGLEDNALCSWHEVVRLGGLPHLTRLALSGNPLPSVTYPATPVPLSALFDSSSSSSSHQEQQQQQQPAFASLQALLLADCRISSWRDVDQLNRFPALQELRLTGNPLFSTAGPAASAADATVAEAAGEAAAPGGAAGQRYEVIGRVGGLTLLNGADVKPRERRDCELRYLQAILGEQQQQQQQLAAAPGGTGGQQQQQEGDGGGEVLQHPRLAQLQAKYGSASVVASAAGGAAAAGRGSALGASVVELLLQHGGGISVRKRLPLSITLGALRLLVGRLFKLPPDQLSLLLLPPAPSDACQAGGEQQQQQQDLSDADDTKQLSYWEPGPGWRVVVTHVDATAARQQQEQAERQVQRQQEARMAQQLQQGEALRSAAAAGS